MGALVIIIIALAGCLAITYSEYCKQRFLANMRADEIRVLKASQSAPTPNNQVDKQDVEQFKKPLIINSAIARRMMERSNADYFSAERKKFNSEIVKENANG